MPNPQGDPKPQGDPYPAGDPSPERDPKPEGDPNPAAPGQEIGDRPGNAGQHPGMPPEIDAEDSACSPCRAAERVCGTILPLGHSPFQN